MPSSPKEGKETLRRACPPTVRAVARSSAASASWPAALAAGVRDDLDPLVRVSLERRLPPADLPLLPLDRHGRDRAAELPGRLRRDPMAPDDGRLDDRFDTARGRLLRRPALLRPERRHYGSGG